MPPKKNAAQETKSSGESVSKMTLRERKPSTQAPINNKPKKVSAKKRKAKEEIKAVTPKKREVDTEVDNDLSSKSETIYEFKAKTNSGEEVPLSKYEGHVCIIVNVASKCGYTKSNYEQLVELYNKYSKDKGLRILAFPCNQFGSQEPGDSEKICDFAKKRKVTFDLFEKITVNGKTAHPLWKFLKLQKDGPKGEDIDWNFTKFLINKKGEVVERYKSSVQPKTLVKELEKLW
ncbi:uncharacterized protein LOC132698127 [Cylas formicarius]|uniref:uncharacterized protein LOC132698127 n=1 Tax=Cylas formicarius TaxID=197179 RepID=UPI0029588924|nr:uncharacterized protein LOC132698127 [Cylas formicarius]